MNLFETLKLEQEERQKMDDTCSICRIKIQLGNDICCYCNNKKQLDKRLKEYHRARKKSKKIQCVCGSIIDFVGLNAHLSTDKHIDFMFDSWSRDIRNKSTIKNYMRKN